MNNKPSCSLLASLLRIPAAGEAAPDLHRDMRKEIHKYVPKQTYFGFFGGDQKPYSFLQKLLWRDVIFLWKSWYTRNGKLETESTLKNGNLYGEYKHYCQDGTLFLHRFYDEHHESYKEYYMGSETLRYHSNYEHGQLHGEHSHYLDNGSLHIHCFHKKGNLHGEYREYYRDKGTKLNIHCYYESGELHGPYRKYHEDGKTLEVECTYKNGQLLGDCKKRNRDGTLKKHCTYHSLSE